MRNYNKHFLNLWVLLIYGLITLSCLAVFFFSDTAALFLLILTAAAHTACLVVVKRTVSKIENDSADKLRCLKASYHKKLRVLSLRLKKRRSAYTALQTSYKKLRQQFEQISKSADSGQTPDSAYMLPFSESEETVLNLHTIAAEAAAELEAFSKAHRIRIQLVAAQEELLFLCSPERMRILFRNIIDNSIKYMCRPGNLVITLSFIGDDIFIIFKDDGQGLPEHELQHIFELNYQGSNRLSGNGLGLAQAKAIVDFYHGTIFAKSRPDHGMAVYIQFPYAPHHKLSQQ